MKAEQWLANHMSEECSEVSKELSKLFRFGSHEVSPKHPISNIQRVQNEFDDLICAFMVLSTCAGVKLEFPTQEKLHVRITKMRKYLDYSVECGMLPEEVKEEVLDYAYKAIGVGRVSK